MLSFIPTVIFTTLFILTLPPFTVNATNEILDEFYLIIEVGNKLALYAQNCYQ